MSKSRILVVEDEADIANLLQIYFAGQGYDVDMAVSGSQALSVVRQTVPDLIVLDILLPDVDGYTLCAELRTKARTSRIPIIFLTQKDSRSDLIMGLELGADDYITKPFDIEELHLRVQNAIGRAKREALTDSRTGLPGSQSIEEQLRNMLLRPSWAVIDCRINHFDTFRDLHGPVAADEVIRYAAKTIETASEELGGKEAFTGHGGSDSFLVVTSEPVAAQLRKLLKQRFAKGIADFYSPSERKQHYVWWPASGSSRSKVPLMSLAVGIATASQREFADTREITQAASEDRRKDAFASQPIVARLPGRKRAKTS